MNILEKIVNEIKNDLIEKKNLLSFESLKKNIDYDSNSFSLYDSLNNDYVSLIAEIKDTSPSKGKLMNDKNFINLAKNVVAVIDKRNTKIKPTQAVKTTHSRGCSN